MKALFSRILLSKSQLFVASPMRFNTLDEWLNWQESYHPKKIDLGLDRVKKVLDALGYKWNALLTITVAGTNGKGSSIAFLDAILRTEGYRVGTYTSPHFLKYNERIRVNGQSVADDQICQAFARIDQAREQISLSYFEFGTLAALDIFSTSNLDIQLLEVGLGGRLDAVNTVDAHLALITSIGIDHSDWLGQSRQEIGAEKAGILRQNALAVTGDPDPPQSLLQHASDQKVQLSCLNRDFDYTVHKIGWNWSNAKQNFNDLPHPALRGKQQFQNAAAVLQALTLISNKLSVSETAIRQGLESVQLSGRFQCIPGDVPVLLDVAHNPQAADSLATYLQENYSDHRIITVFSIMRDKDIEKVVMNMNSVVDHWYLAPLNSFRTASDSQIVDVFRNCLITSYSNGFSDFIAAFKAAKQDAKKGDLIVIFGSFYLVAEYLAQQN